MLVGCGGGGGLKTPAGPVCKSCKPYFVRGSWHYPQKHYEYDQTGLASWYGPGFHGKPKPYGEPMDQNAMTAAHETLPLPTIAKVTNLETGKHVIVLIDDRGPFTYEGRIIDLSMEAAKRLGTYAKGIGRVRVQSMVGESQAMSHYLSRYKNGRDPSGRTWIQIYYDEIQGKHGDYAVDLGGSVVPEKVVSSQIATSLPAVPEKLDAFLKKTVGDEAPKQAVLGKIFISVGQQFVQKPNAENCLKTLQPLLPQGKVVQKAHSGGQKFYTIEAGPFADPAAAKKVIAELSKKGYADAVIIQE
jgi:rare lipoprotein A